MKAVTPTAVVEFDGTMVTITRSILGKQGRGVKTIPLASIGSVQLRPPSPMSLRSDGVWSVSVTGEVQSSTSKRGRGAAKRDAKHDENSVVIGPGHVKAFQALTDAINAAKSAPAAPVVQAPPDREALIGQLRQLGAMHHRGAIDDATFIREMHEVLPQL